MVVPFHTFLTVMSRVGAIVVLVGLLPFIGFPVDFGVVELTTWRRSFVHPAIPVITSIFIKPNHLGFIALMGVIAAIYEWKMTGSTAAKVLLSIHCIGLFLTDYRAAWLGLIAASTLFFIYTKGGRAAGIFATFTGLIALPTLLLMLLGLFPAPAMIAEISLSGRTELWVSNLQLFRDHILWGVNFTGISINPHNSYLRMFVAFGAVGGFLYCVLALKPVVGSAREAQSIPGIILTLILICLVIIQLFNQLSFVGISMRSTMISVMIGYYVTEQVPGESRVQSLNASQ
jgi:O-antigen ligase